METAITGGVYYKDRLMASDLGPVIYSSFTQDHGHDSGFVLLAPCSVAGKSGLYGDIGNYIARDQEEIAFDQISIVEIAQGIAGRSRVGSEKDQALERRSWKFPFRGTERRADMSSRKKTLEKME